VKWLLQHQPGAGFCEPLEGDLARALDVPREVEAGRVAVGVQPPERLVAGLEPLSEPLLLALHKRRVPAAAMREAPRTGGFVGGYARWASGQKPKASVPALRLTWSAKDLS
jgi:hypothetical protein